ncbi:MAG: murein L,D-transpeptidase catalytic domain-containing protein [Niabella sp.]
MKHSGIIIFCIAGLVLISTIFIKTAGLKNLQLSAKAAITPALNVQTSTTPYSEEQLKALKHFIVQNKYNNRYCFLINMQMHSGSNRFFVYDLKKDTIVKSGLVTHGRCNEYWLEGRKYSNTVGGGCTSLGKYKIGKSYYGKFGLAYKLYGLDSTNNNAFERFVVLHSHSCVPEYEKEMEICQSDGCPTVSPGFLKQLQKIIDASKQPILLWIYE